MMLQVRNHSVSLPTIVIVVRWVLLGLVLATTSSTTTRMMSIGSNVLVSGFLPLQKSVITERRRKTTRTGNAANTSIGSKNSSRTNHHNHRSLLGFTSSASASSQGTSRRRRTGVVVQNMYDDWRKFLVLLICDCCIYEPNIKLTITEYDHDSDRQQMIGTRNENEGNLYL